jgi:hypothetical protein
MTQTNKGGILRLSVGIKIPAGLSWLGASISIENVAGVN